MTVQTMKVNHVERPTAAVCDCEYLLTNEKVYSSHSSIHVIMC